MKRATSSPIMIPGAPPSSPATPIVPAKREEEERIYSCASEGCAESYASAARLVRHCIEDHGLAFGGSPSSASNLDKERSPNMYKSVLSTTEQKCSICAEPIVAAGVLSPCGDGTFCYTCISDYRQRGSDRCPVCQWEIDKITKLYV